MEKFITFLRNLRRFFVNFGKLFSEFSKPQVDLSKRVMADDPPPDTERVVPPDPTGVTGF